MISEKSIGFPKASEKERMMTNQNVNSSKIKNEYIKDCTHN